MSDAIPAASLDRHSALRYVRAWAEKVHDKLHNIVDVPDGDFYGQVGSIYFEYLAKERTLKARAVVEPFASYLVTSSNFPNFQHELRRIETSHPETVAHAHFDLIEGRWQSRKEPALYLRADITDSSKREEIFVEQMKELGDTAYLWSRKRFNDAVVNFYKSKDN